MIAAFFVFLTLSQDPIAIHGEITIPADKAEVEGRVFLINPNPRKIPFDARGVSLLDDNKKPIPNVMVETEPRQFFLSERSKTPWLIRLSDARFFGGAVIQFKSQEQSFSIVVSRGLRILSKDLDLHRDQPARIEVENPGEQTLRIIWMMRSEFSDLCLQTSCTDIGDWFPLQIGPHRTASLNFTPPDDWFHRDNTTATLFINYSKDRRGSEQVAALPAKLSGFGFWDGARHWMAALVAWCAPTLRLLRIFVCIAVGAGAFWFSSVLLGNYQLFLATRKRLRDLRSRAESISSAAGSRSRSSLLEACDAILDKAKENRFLPEYSQTFELTNDRLAAFERRVRLGEKLDAAYFQFDVENAERELPLSVLRAVKHSLRDVEQLMVGDVSADDLTRADQMLGALGIDERMRGLPQVFRDRLRRIQSDIKRFGWQAEMTALAKDFPAAMALQKIDLADASQANVLDDDPAERDLDLTQLELLCELIALPSPKQRADILEFARGRSPYSLQRAQSLIKQNQEGIFEADFLKALKNGEWDPYFEPDPIPLGSTLKMYIKFQREALDCCAACQSFRCYWSFSQPEGSEEAGWQAYRLVQSFEEVTVTPSFRYVDTATPEVINTIFDREKNASRPIKGIPILASWPETKNRLGGEVLQLLLTLIVPIVTVLLVEFQKSSELGILPLMTVGFTAEVVRTAVKPKEPASQPKTKAA